MDLQTTYMDLDLRNPLIASASPLSEDIDQIRRMEDAGAAAIVFFSLFEEQIQQEAEALEHFLTNGQSATTTSTTHPPQHFQRDPEQYLNLISRAASMLDIPVIGSLNGVSDDGWTEYARMIEQAGAQGLELNIQYLPTDIRMGGAEVESRYIYILESVKSAVRIPVAVKLNPFFSNIANMAHQLDQAGADALVLFNRFYQTDIDLNTLQSEPSLHLSTPYEIRLPLLWIGILRGKVSASLAGSRGVHGAQEVLKYLLAGADAVMTTSSLIQFGVDHIQTILREMTEWMDARGYTSVSAMKGLLSAEERGDAEYLARAQYIRVLQEFDREPLSTRSGRA